MSKLTLSDIADKAGVSPATVSRVINNYPHVRDEIRERVQRIIRDTGYAPNLSAKSLASKRTGIIGLVIPRTVHAFFTDPYFPRLTEGIAQACNQYNYTLALFLVYTEEDEQKLIPRMTRQGLVDGIIIQATHLEDEVLGSLVNGNVPFLVAGRPMALRDLNYVDVDNVSGAHSAVTHLILAGRKRIATITGALSTGAGIDRLEGYKKAFRERGIEIKERLIEDGGFSESGAYNAMRKILPQQPDAVFVASDTMAMGALRAIREGGQTVPGDIALVGFDDLPPAKRTDPPLTTVRQPVRRFGIRAVETLIDIIENGQSPPRRIIFETELVVRASCGTGLLRAWK